MKITIAYQADETRQAQAIAAVARHILGIVKVSKSDRHKPFLHIYISTRERPATDWAKETG